MLQEDDDTTISTLVDSSYQRDWSTTSDSPMVRKIECQSSSPSFPVSTEPPCQPKRCQSAIVPRRLHNDDSNDDGNNNCNNDNEHHFNLTESSCHKFTIERRPQMRLEQLRSETKCRKTMSECKVKEKRIQKLERYNAQLQGKIQELMQSQSSQAILQQQLDAAKRQIEMFQMAWNDNMNLHTLDIEVYGDQFWQLQKEIERYKLENDTLRQQLADTLRKLELTTGSQVSPHMILPSPHLLTAAACQNDNSLCAESETMCCIDNLEHRRHHKEGLPGVGQVNLQKNDVQWMQFQRNNEQYCRAEWERYDTETMTAARPLQAQNQALLDNERRMRCTLDEYQDNIAILRHATSNLLQELKEVRQDVYKAEKAKLRLDTTCKQLNHESSCLRDQIKSLQLEVMGMADLKKSNHELCTDNQNLQNSLAESSNYVTKLELAIVHLEASLVDANNAKSRLADEKERIAAMCHEEKRIHAISKEKQKLVEKQHRDCLRELHFTIFGIDE